MRLFGADAFELGQQGRNSAGQPVPLGTETRDFMAPRIPGLPFTSTGSSSYGRPVGSLGTPGDDPAQALLRNGLGMATPEYLRGSQQFAPYMEAERLARLNHLGGFQTNAETPSQFRHGNGPWAGAQPGVYGQGADAVFADEPTPFQGLRPDIAKGYIAIWQDPKSTPDDLLAYAKANGFTLDPAQVRKKYDNRNKGAIPGSEVTYAPAPVPLIDPGDGRTGAFLRGLGDPINMIDELGGLADTLGIPSPGAGGPRETIFNAPPGTRFGDVLWNNIDQNRAILAHDEATHPNLRFTGQLASGLAIPVGGVEGVAAKATEEALANGATRFAAQQAARKALATRLAAIGGAEGGAMGFGGAEGNPLQRLPSAAVGAAGGAVLAPLVGEAANALTPLVRRGVNALRRGRGEGMFAPTPPANDIGPGVPPIDPETLRAINGGATANGVTVKPPAQMRGVPPMAPEDIERVNGGFSVSSDPERLAAMAADKGSSIASDPLIRQRDYLNVGDIPPPPEGYSPIPPFGVTRPMNERLSAEEMAKLAEGVDPRSVLPRPGNVVESLSEAEAANPGRFVDLQAPDEMDQLRVRRIGSRNDLFRGTRIRGPLDMTQALRTMGGIQDQGGELSHLGITNEPRRMDFGSNEQFLGKLVNNETGMPLDEAAHRLWEQG
jgi:hypothetical protein